MPNIIRIRIRSKKQYSLTSDTDIVVFPHHSWTDSKNSNVSLRTYILKNIVPKMSNISVFPYHGRADRKNSDHIITSTPPHSQPVFSGFSRFSYSVQNFEITFKLPTLSFLAGHSVLQLFQVPKMFSCFIFQPSSCSLPSFSILHQLLVPQLLPPQVVLPQKLNSFSRKRASCHRRQFAAS